MNRDKNFSYLYGGAGYNSSDSSLDVTATYDMLSYMKGNRRNYSLRVGEHNPVSNQFGQGMLPIFRIRYKPKSTCKVH